MGGFEGMQRAHGRFERPGKDIATIAKTIMDTHNSHHKIHNLMIVRTKKPSNVKI